ncbi:MAG: YDG domain-containing protein, partial [Oscillospiraceae bacterium]
GTGDNGHQSYGTSAGTITITGGKIYALGAQHGAGIGGGYANKGGSVTIDGDAVVYATKGNDAPNHIGNGMEGENTAVNLNKGIVFDGNDGNVYGSVTLQKDLTLPFGKNLTISSGKTLTIPSYKTLTAYKILFLDGGRIEGNGNVRCYGTCKASIVSEDIRNIPTQVYTGNAIEPTVTVNPTRNILGCRFTVVTDDFAKSWHDNTNVGTAKVVYTKGSQRAEKTFEIAKSGTKFESLNAYKGDGNTPTTKFTYGDIITVKAKPIATGTVANRAEHKPNQMALYLGAEQLCAPVDPVNGVYTMAYNTVDKKLAPAYSTITAKYTGNPTMAGASGDIQVTLWPKALTATAVEGRSRVYDGSADFASVPLTLTPTDLLSGDTVTAMASGKAASANVGTHAFTATKTTLSGTNANYYTLDPATVSGSVSIAQKAVTVTVTAQSKVYDGATTAPVTYAVIGKVGADDVAATVTANFVDENVGTSKTVNLSIGLSGTKAGNYNLTSPSTATTKASITQKPLKWNGPGNVSEKPYDGEKAAISFTPPPMDGVIDGEDVTVNVGTVAFAGVNVGTHAITTTGTVTLSGADAKNYSAPTGK